MALQPQRLTEHPADVRPDGHVATGWLTPAQVGGDLFFIRLEEKGPTTRPAAAALPNRAWLTNRGSR